MASFRLAHADDELNLPPEPADGATRVWLSDQQWMAILERIERQSRSGNAVRAILPHEDPSERRGDGMDRQPLSAKCMIRIGSPGHEAGTYLVRTRNISSGGLGFVCQHAFDPGTRCTVALQLSDGMGRIIAGKIAWCREVMQLEVEQAMFEVGVTFDQLIPIRDDDPDTGPSVA